MKRSVLTGLVLAAVLAVWAFGQAAAPGEAPHIGEGALPQFAKDPSWPKVPAKWITTNTQRKAN